MCVCARARVCVCVCVCGALQVQHGPSQSHSPLKALFYEILRNEIFILLDLLLSLDVRKSVCGGGHGGGVLGVGEERIVCWVVGCLMSQLHDSVFQGRGGERGKDKES